MTTNPTTRIRHCQLDYLSSKSWTVPPVVIDSPIQNLFMKYINNSFTWDVLLENANYTATFGQLIQDDVINYYSLLGIPDDLFPNRQAGIVVQPRIVDNSVNTNAFLTTTTPDGTISGGNVRGKYAVDLQMIRTLPNQVASGESSVISGGSDNTASGLVSTVSGGYMNIASGDYSTISGGSDNTASGDYSTVSGGESNAAVGKYSVVSGGYSNIASGSYSGIAGGYKNRATSEYSYAAGKYNNPDIVAVLGHRRFTMGGGTSDDNRYNLFTVYSSGNIGAKGTFSGSGADVAEYYETNGSKLPVGTTVVFTNVSQFIRASTVEDNQENILGVVSDTAGFLLNVHEQHWHGTYIKSIVEEINEIHEYEDVERLEEKIVKRDGRYYLYKETIIDNVIVTEEVDILDYDSKQVIGTKIVPKVKCKQPIMVEVSNNSPLYDPTLYYRPRSQRDEWHAIGLLGKCKILKGQAVNAEWTLIDSTDDVYDWYLIR